jgi:hypothetical protein
VARRDVGHAPAHQHEPPRPAVVAGQPSPEQPVLPSQACAHRGAPPRAFPGEQLGALVADDQVYGGAGSRLYRRGLVANCEPVRACGNRALDEQHARQLIAEHIELQQTVGVLVRERRALRRLQHQHLPARARSREPDRFGSNHGRQVPGLLIQERMLRGGEARHAVASDTVDPWRCSRPECCVGRGGERGPHGDHRLGDSPLLGDSRERRSLSFGHPPVDQPIGAAVERHEDYAWGGWSAGAAAGCHKKGERYSRETDRQRAHQTRCARHSHRGEMLARDCRAGLVSGTLSPAAHGTQTHSPERVRCCGSSEGASSCTWW